MSRLILSMIVLVALPGFAAQNPSTTNTEASTAAIATNRSQETCPWPANLDAVKAAPETHKVIFENEHIRVLEVTAFPQRHCAEKIRMRTLTLGKVTVCFGALRIREILTHKFTHNERFLQFLSATWQPPRECKSLMKTCMPRLSRQRPRVRVPSSPPFVH